MKRTIKVKTYRRKGKKVKSHIRKIKKKRLSDLERKRRDDEWLNLPTFSPVQTIPEQTMDDLNQNVRDRDWHFNRIERMNRDIGKLEDEKMIHERLGHEDKIIDTINKIEEKERLRAESESIWLK